MSIQGLRHGLAAALLLLPVSGCSVFLPPNLNSEHTEGERVEIELLKEDQFKKDPSFERDYREAFDLQDDGDFRQVFPKDMGAEAAVDVAGGVAALVGVAVDFVEKELRKEASRYEAQFGATLTGDRFWVTGTASAPKLNSALATRVLKRDFEGDSATPKTRSEVKTYRILETPDLKLRMNYVGFRVRRTIPAHDEPAFDLWCGICPSADGQLLRIAPLRFRTTRAKCKVLSDSLWWWLFPPTWLGKVLRNGGHEIDTTVSIEFDGYWKDREQRVHVDKVAALKLEFPAYDINEGALLRSGLRGDRTPVEVGGAADERTEESAPAGPDSPVTDASAGVANHRLEAAGPGAPERPMPKGPGGWLVSLPLSQDATGKPIVPGGAFTLKVTVTERDRSNAAALLTDGAELVADNRDKVVESAKKLAEQQLDAR